MMSTRRTGIVLAVLLAIAGCGVNQSIRVADGESVEGDRSTVNGAISIGTGCEVRGDYRTVNGRVTVGSGSAVGALATVNGPVRIGSGATVEGDVDTVNGAITIAEDFTVNGDLETVNGAISCAEGQLSGDVSTVNGAIELRTTVVDGRVSTTNGAIILTGASRVTGDVVIKGTQRFGIARPALEIAVRDGSVVEGDILVRDDRRTVRLVLSGGGRVLGRTENVELVQEP